jgi:hypothetical protein
MQSRISPYGYGAGAHCPRAGAARRRIARTADLQAAARAANPGCVACGQHWSASEGLAVSLGERDVAYWHLADVPTRLTDVRFRS